MARTEVRGSVHGDKAPSSNGPTTICHGIIGWYCNIGCAMEGQVFVSTVTTQHLAALGVRTPHLADLRWSAFAGQRLSERSTNQENECPGLSLSGHGAL